MSHGSAIALVSRSLERYPRSELRDIYKLLFQTFHGAEHAVSDIETARLWLMREWESLPASGANPLIEPIFIEGDPPVTPPLHRLHLVPAKASGIDPERILSEFLRTTADFPRAYPAETDDLHQAFLSAWENLGDAIRRGDLDFDFDNYRAFSCKMKQEGWPAAHHSTAFRKAYDPHYRLVMDALIAET